MVVRKPLNINDEDIFDGMGQVERPPSQPTEMSYFLQRIRLAEISRSIVDRTPLAMSNSGGPSYCAVMDIDTELQTFINDIPSFFSMGKDRLIESFQLDPAKAQVIITQGYMLHSLISSQRCKLHLPYLTRGFADPAYASSREICIKSARLVIQTELQLENSDFCKFTRLKFMGLLLGVFMASIVLLMDLCLNRSSPQQEKQRGDVADAFRILEEARDQSVTAAKLLDSLMHVLRKHQAPPPKLSGLQQLNPRDDNELPSTTAGRSEGCEYKAAQQHSKASEAPLPTNSPGVPGVDESDCIGPAYGLPNGENSSSYFAELAQSFEHGVGIDSFDWDSIFQDLTPHFFE
jgi:hypothetical protein